MREALEFAKIAESEGEVPVGCVVVREGEIVGSGYNTREREQNALSHAELLAINMACKNIGFWRLPDCELYVTLEPCPMCAGAIINSRIAKVYYGALDPKSGACGSVVNLFDYPFNHKPEAAGGILARESAELLSGFFRKLRSKKL